MIAVSSQSSTADCSDSQGYPQGELRNRLLPKLRTATIFHFRMDSPAEVTPRQSLGQRIKDARTGIPKSRWTVAREVGCTPETIRNIEEGRTSSTATRLAAICRSVGLTLSLEELADAEAS